MKFGKDVALSVGYAIAIVLVYINRYSLDQMLFYLVFFGLMLAGAFAFARKFLWKDPVSWDERTLAVSGKAAKITLLAAFFAIIGAMLYLTITERPTHPNAVLTVLLAVVSVVYYAVFAYLENK